MLRLTIFGLVRFLDTLNRKGDLKFKLETPWISWELLLSANLSNQDLDLGFILNEDPRLTVRYNREAGMASMELRNLGLPMAMKLGLSMDDVTA